MDNSHPLAKLLRFRPNNFMTALEFREAMTMQLCAYGNAYAHVERNSVGDVISMVPLMSANMEVRLSDNGKILSIATDGTLNTPTFHRKKFFISKGLASMG